MNQPPGMVELHFFAGTPRKRVASLLFPCVPRADDEVTLEGQPRPLKVRWVQWRLEAARPFVEVFCGE